MNSLQGLCLLLADLLRGQAPDLATVTKQNDERKRRQDLARAHLATWRAKPVTAPTFVTQSEYVDRLLVLVEKPFKIQQAGFGVCGPNACLAALLHDYPDELVRCATALFERKPAILGQRALTLTPTVCTRTHKEIDDACRLVKKVAPPGADWLLFSAVQSDLQSSYNGLPAGVNERNMPAEVERFMQAIGYYGTVSSKPVRSSLDGNLSSKRANDSQLVILHLDSSLIGTTRDDVVASANHLVYLERIDLRQEDGDDWVTVWLYSWGELVVRNFELSDFVGAVRGYIYGTRSY